MKKIYVFTLLFINIVCLLTKAAENQTNYIIKLPDIHTLHDAQQALRSLHNPFPKKIKSDYIDDWTTGNRKLDKGMFQFFIYEQFIGAQPLQVSKEKIHDYFLYRIAKYSYQTLITILNNESFFRDVNNINTNTIKAIGMLQSWIQLYEDIQWFCKDNNRKLLTPMTVFNYGFLNGLLIDCSRLKNNSYVYIIRLFTKYILKKSGNGTTHKHLLNTYTSILDLYNGIKPEDAVPLAQTKTFAAHYEQFIMPIIQKSSKIGLLPLIIAVIKRYCIVGIGYEESSLHSGHYKGITGPATHDILHFNVQMLIFLNKRYFFKDVLNTLPTMIKDYKKAKAEGAQNNNITCFFALFIVIHELVIEKGISCKDKTMSNELQDFFRVSTNYHFNKQTYDDMVFNLTDLYILYETIYPSLTKLALTNNILINQNNMFERLDGPNESITCHNIIQICNKLIYCIADSWNTFIDTYGHLIKDQLFKKDNMPQLADRLGIKQT